jgi:hypothetical protein
MTDEEFVSFFVSVINCLVYASLEDPKIDGPGQISFDTPNQINFLSLSLKFFVTKSLLYEYILIYLC